jgi:ABC-type glycerol-3-phosphate transport system substrate-binding protein
MKKNTLALFLACGLIISASQLVSCQSSSTAKNYAVNSSLSNESQDVTLNFVGSSYDFLSMETTIDDFQKLYPHCTITYEYLQDYSDAVLKRLQSNTNIDFFLTSNIQTGLKTAPLMPYALNLYEAANKIDFSSCFEGLVKNFELTEDNTKLYALPMGSDMRGMFVNNTLLKKLSIETPTKTSEFLAACKTLKDAGYIPLQGNPSNFAQRLMFPWVANSIANASDYNAIYTRVNNAEEGLSNYFRDQMAFMYDLVKNYYYDYATVEDSYKVFYTDASLPLNFLNIVRQSDGTYAEGNPSYFAAFAPGMLSQIASIQKAKDNYHSTVDFSFILSPITEQGGCAYLSPADGVAINKNSSHLLWAEEFLKYFFSTSANKHFAEKQNLIPNTSDAMNYITSVYKIPSSQISHLGQVSFRYLFYTTIVNDLVAVSKANKEKYREKADTAADSEVEIWPNGKKNFTLDHFMNLLEADFAAVRAKLTASSSESSSAS